MKLSIIIPVFNEEKTIAQVIKRVENEKIPKITKEIIIVDDGSTDETKDEISKISLQQIKNLYKKKINRYQPAPKTSRE